jgi:hypothetical protein
MDISYLNTPGGDVAVYIGNRRAGTIISVGAGFAYVPVGQRRRDHSEVFVTVATVKQSIEAM